MLKIRLGRRDVLRLGTAGLLGGCMTERARASLVEAKAPAQSVIVVFLGGGLSHHDTFDPKPDAPAEVKGKYSTIATAEPGVRFGEKIPLLEARQQHYTLVRSGSHANDHHETATNWVLSGRFCSAFGDYPALGAVV